MATAKKITKTVDGVEYPVAVDYAYKDGAGNEIASTYATPSYVDEKIDDLAESLAGFNFEVVSALPSTGSGGTIYLVQDTSSSNYLEYVWSQSESAFKQIGTTEIDLTNYMTTNTAQTVSGAKTFTGDIVLNGATFADKATFDAGADFAGTITLDGGEIKDSTKLQVTPYAIGSAGISEISYADAYIANKTLHIIFSGTAKRTSEDIFAEYIFLIHYPSSISDKIVPAFVSSSTGYVAKKVSTVVPATATWGTPVYVLFDLIKWTDTELFILANFRNLTVGTTYILREEFAFDLRDNLIPQYGTLTYSSEVDAVVHATHVDGTETTLVATATATAEANVASFYIETEGTATVTGNIISGSNTADDPYLMRGNGTVTIA